MDSSGCVGVGSTVWPWASQEGSLPTASWATVSCPIHAWVVSCDGPTALGGHQDPPSNTRGLLELLPQPIVVLSTGQAFCPARQEAFVTPFPVCLPFTAQPVSPEEAPRFSGPQLRSPVCSLLPCPFPDSSRGALSYRGQTCPPRGPHLDRVPALPWGSTCTQGARGQGVGARAAATLTTD